MTPMPPACAMAIAMRASVTVSIAEAMIGMLSAIVAGEPGADVDVGRQHFGVAGPQQHVVEGQAFDELIGEMRAMANSWNMAVSEIACPTSWRGSVARAFGFAKGSQHAIRRRAAVRRNAPLQLAAHGVNSTASHAPSRLLPLIIATALFMENTDSTVIATSLPMIAAETWAIDPIALKLAVTSYLVSLAIFIPISGWMADRFGVAHGLPAALAVFMAGSLACACRPIARRLRRRRASSRAWAAP